MLVALFLSVPSCFALFFSLLLEFVFEGQCGSSVTFQHCPLDPLGRRWDGVIWLQAA